MNKWIKPSELPPKFHGECFVAWKSHSDSPYASKGVAIEMIQNYYRGTIPERYSEIERNWEYISDELYRVMVIDIPQFNREIFE